jgi:hypothetical protein
MDGDSAGRDAVLGKEGQPGIAHTIQTYSPSSKVYTPPLKYFDLNKDPDEMDSSEISDLLVNLQEFNGSLWSSLIGENLSFESLET